VLQLSCNIAENGGYSFGDEGLEPVPVLLVDKAVMENTHALVLPELHQAFGSVKYFFLGLQ
jgi:hypothetical protein